MFSAPIANSQLIAWSSVDDCALAAIVLLEQDCFGGDYLVSESEDVTGDGLATHLSIGLGKQITYHAEALDDFERSIDAAKGPGMSLHVASKFRSHPQV